MPRPRLPAARGGQGLPWPLLCRVATPLVFLSPGAGADALAALADGSSPFSKVLKGASKPALLIGQGAMQGPDAAAVGALARKIAADCGVVADGWNGWCVLQHTGLPLTSP